MRDLNRTLARIGFGGRIGGKYTKQGLDQLADRRVRVAEALGSNPRSLTSLAKKIKTLTA